MADELNVPTHRWYEPRNNISLPKTDFSAQTIYASGIQKIDAWINSQPWGNPVPGLFALAEPGVWYDPSDLTTLFQDAAGTTPVTAAGQPVGLVLDKSKGLVLGPELRGTGTTGLSGTAAAATYNTGTGVGTASRVDSGNQSFVSFGSTVANKFYLFSIQNTGAVSLVIRINNSVGTVLQVVNSGASFAGYVTGGTALVVTAQNNGTTASFTVVSVKELPGNHATQTTAASRPTYQIVNGFPCLVFDGVDDFLITPTITPGIDKAQVFAGVRKLSDAVGGMIAETSVNANSTNGTLRITPGNNAAGNLAFYSWSSRGTVQAQIETAGVFASPITNVITGLGDISGDVARLRVNGSQVAETLTNQGTGNYLAYPVYIGRRAGTSLPFNGNLFSLIVRFGANLDANTITNTETWVNGKTGAY